MNIEQIERQIKDLAANFNEETFIYDFLRCYGIPKSSIAKLTKGNLNLSNEPGVISWKKRLLYKESKSDSLVSIFDSLKSEVNHDQRFVIATNFNRMIALDTKTGEKEDFEFHELLSKYAFFLPLAGMEKATLHHEAELDMKAAHKMAVIFDEIKRDNPDESEEFRHGLNVFFSRLLFCFFAEDTDIFQPGQFTNALKSFTQKDGSDLRHFIEKLFVTLDTPENKREHMPAHLSSFPYVNGGLFSGRTIMPEFTAKSRKAIISTSEMDWSGINPDIFGSMIQAVITSDHRGNMGMHYTSVPNIMKVIDPLFLNDLKKELDRCGTDRDKLKAFQTRLSKIKFFDPACGSGNFLIITYKEIRKLEMEVLKKLPGEMLMSMVSLTQFYGIELDDCASEIAKLALWLAEHQMNVEFYAEFGRCNPTLPLKDAGQITHGNACRIPWETVCPKNEEDEIYIMGNPPYLGFNLQEKSQKEDLYIVSKSKKLDYISCWFILGSKYIENFNFSYAFVTTNSVCQGEHVNYLWPKILDEKTFIFFAERSFKWTNNAKNKAAVVCSIIGVTNNKKNKYIYQSGHKRIVQNINCYLTESNIPIIKKRNNPISNFPKAVIGSSLYDFGNLTLTPSEKTQIVEKYPESINYFKNISGSNEFINNIERYCVYVDSNSYEKARLISILKDKFEDIKEKRNASTCEGTRKLASQPYKYQKDTYSAATHILIPVVASENRIYTPMGLIGKNTLTLSSAFTIYNPELYHFSIISSSIHLIWAKAVCGRLKTDIRYSNTLCYNTFPFPKISTQRKNELKRCAQKILTIREKYYEKTIAELYDPEKMPKDLLEAHKENDIAVEKCYRSTPFETDDERLDYLFKLYEKMIKEEKTK